MLVCSRCNVACSEADEEITTCSHLGTACSECLHEDRHTLYGQCIYCIFAGQKFETEWDCLGEIWRRCQEPFDMGFEDALKGLTLPKNENLVQSYVFETYEKGYAFGKQHANFLHANLEPFFPNVVAWEVLKHV